jgi:ribosomal protein S3AE
MKNKYTVVTKNKEFNIIEVLHVEAKALEQAHKAAIKKIIEQMICDAGEMSKSDKQEVIDNEELICVLEGHCKCLLQ